MERAQRILLQEGTSKYLRTKASEGYSPRVCRLVTLLIFKLENLQTMHVWKKKGHSTEFQFTAQAVLSKFFTVINELSI